ncbi:MAG TPA: hypothetical protein VMM92_02180 [Thermoanaerobaculia bacterium]|nr:hypothetical protein [Thermoanaerobaculia bacterium]
MPRPRRTPSPAHFLAALCVLAVLLSPAAASADLLVGSNTYSTVLTYDERTGAFLSTLVAPGSGGLNRTDGLRFGPDGRLYVCSEAGSAVLRYDGATGAFIDTFVPVGSGGLTNAEDLVFGAEGDLYVSSIGSSAILRYDGTTGAFKSAFVPAGSGGLNEPVGLAFGPDGNLYVSSLLTHQVLRYDGTTGAFRDAFVPAGSGGLAYPYDLDFGPDGDLYVVSFGTGQVLRYNGVSGVFKGIFVTAGSGGLLNPTYMTFTPRAVEACTPSPTALCLQGGRFRVEVAWVTAGTAGQSGSSGFGQAVPLTADTGFFWFFASTNVELVVKVLDGCGLGGHFWVFAGGLTDVATTLTVTDTATGAVRTYNGRQGVAFAPLQDTAAFPCP